MFVINDSKQQNNIEINNCNKKINNCNKKINKYGKRCRIVDWSS